MRNGEIQQIISYSRKSNGDRPVIELVEKYFKDNVVWSKEKDEWASMDADQRKAFADRITETMKKPTSKTTNGDYTREEKIAAVRKANRAHADARKPVSKAKPAVRPKEKVATRSTGPSKGKARTSKMDVAKEVFKRLTGKGRKEVLAALIKEAKLTTAGANTYYYLLLKKKKG